jgi:hypothetical protein
MEIYDLSAYTLADLIELRDSQLNQMSAFLELKMFNDAYEAKSLADQCKAEMENRNVES